MLTYVSDSLVQYVPVGGLVIFLFLLIYSLLTFVCRLSKASNRTFIFILLAAVFGIINGACLLYLSVASYYNPSKGISSVDYNAYVPAILFGLALVPMTWTSGFSVFSTIIGKSLQVNLSYLLTLIQLVLSIVAAAIIGVSIHNIAVNYYFVYLSLNIAIISLRWLYFLLFFSLVVRNRRLLSGLGKTILISFGVLNTIRLIVETVFINVVTETLNAAGFILLIFFLTDFLSFISMLLIVIFYRKITTNNDHMYDN